MPLQDFKYPIGKRLRFVPYNNKIADINESDTNKHFLDLEAALGETRKIVGLIIRADRVSGSGVFYIYPNEGTAMAVYLSSGLSSPICLIKEGSQRLQYRQSVANDDWDIYCFGYIVEA